MAKAFHGDRPRKSRKIYGEILSFSQRVGLLQFDLTKKTKCGPCNGMSLSMEFIALVLLLSKYVTKSK